MAPTFLDGKTEQDKILRRRTTREKRSNVAAQCMQIFALQERLGWEKVPKEKELFMEASVCVMYEEAFAASLAKFAVENAPFSPSFAPFNWVRRTPSPSSGHTWHSTIFFSSYSLITRSHGQFSVVRTVAFSGAFLRKGSHEFKGISRLKFSKALYTQQCTGFSFVFSLFVHPWKLFNPNLFGHKGVRLWIWKRVLFCKE